MEGFLLFSYVEDFGLRFFLCLRGVIYAKLCIFGRKERKFYGNSDDTVKLIKQVDLSVRFKQEFG